MSIATKSRWFKDSLQFACTQCGKCCKGRTNVFVNAAEIDAISTHLKVPTMEFIRDYTIEKQTADGLLTTLKSSGGKNPGCMFLKDKKCSIYEVRPTQCRTYPFWPQNLIGHAEWKAEGQNCEGISLLNNSSGTAGSVPVPDATVLTNLVVHMVHARGTGPDWTYSESMNHLAESRLQQPEVMDSFENDFFATHYSSVQFENESIRVVDSTTPLPAAAVEEHDDDDDDDEVEHMMKELSKPKDEMEEEVEEDATVQELLQTFRRLEFASLPNVTQSEVQLIPGELGESADTSSYVVDHSVVTLPVHQVLAELCLQHVVPLCTNHINNSSSNDCNGGIRVALIGAGGCVLPNHLLHAVEHNPHHANVKLCIDAIEPDADVLFAAETFFDTHFDDERLVKQPADGVTFLRSRSNHQPYDVMIIDAFEPAEHSEGSESHSRAPPVSLLQNHALIKAALTGSQGGRGGVLLVNVFGDGAWLRSVLQTYSTNNGFTSPVVVVVSSSEVEKENNYLLVTSPVQSAVEELVGSLMENGGEKFSCQETKDRVVFVYNG